MRLMTAMILFQKLAAVNSNNAVNKSENPQYIENNLIIDGRKAARMITPYVAKELSWENK